MTNLIKAAHDARLLLKGFKAFADVADALEAAGQLEQRTAEAESQLAALLPKIADARAEVAAAEEQAANTVALASQQAAGLVAKAEVKASEMLAAAQAQAAEKVAAADKLVAERQAAAVSAAAERDSALVKRNALDKECSELETRLAKAQASIAKLLG